MNEIEETLVYDALAAMMRHSYLLARLANEGVYVPCVKLQSVLGRDGMKRGRERDAERARARAECGMGFRVSSDDASDELKAMRDVPGRMGQAAAKCAFDSLADATQVTTSGLASWACDGDRFEPRDPGLSRASFPCGACKHNDKSDRDEPCCVCGHNISAVILHERTRR
jgi:hypothetical protein